MHGTRNTHNLSSYSVIEKLSNGGIWRSVAVPSRLYNIPSAAKPLAGARISIKDIYKLRGTKRTMMSRSYTELYEAEAENADYVKKLISAGAIIVGKTKITQFAGADEPTDQWIDFHCPINPRGDRYQSPSGSSTGAAASLAGYPWLDYALGGDCESCSTIAKLLLMGVQLADRFERLRHAMGSSRCGLHYTQHLWKALRSTRRKQLCDLEM